MGLHFYFRQLIIIVIAALTLCARTDGEKPHWDRWGKPTLQARDPHHYLYLGAQSGAGLAFQSWSH